MQAIGQRKVFVLEERSKKPLCFVTSKFCSQNPQSQSGPHISCRAALGSLQENARASRLGQHTEPWSREQRTLRSNPRQWRRKAEPLLETGTVSAPSPSANWLQCICCDVRYDFQINVLLSKIHDTI